MTTTVTIRHDSRGKLIRPQSCVMSCWGSQLTEKVGAAGKSTLFLLLTAPLQCVSLFGPLAIELIYNRYLIFLSNDVFDFPMM